MHTDPLVDSGARGTIGNASFAAQNGAAAANLAEAAAATGYAGPSMSPARGLVSVAPHDAAAMLYVRGAGPLPGTEFRHSGPALAPVFAAAAMSTAPTAPQAVATAQPSISTESLPFRTPLGYASATSTQSPRGLGTWPMDLECQRSLIEAQERLQR